MRTLLISDLHLGQRPGHDVLQLQGPRARLLDALEGIDRLVLLGDTVELALRRHRRSPLQAAAPVLAAIARRMGPDREIVLVPGNHDALMIRRWALARGGALGLADEVPLDATPALAAVTRLLAPATVRVRYPGLWVRDDVWATHGHYLDRHLVPESTFGLRREGGRRRRRAGSGGRAVSDAGHALDDAGRAVGDAGHGLGDAGHGLDDAGRARAPAGASGVVAPIEYELPRRGPSTSEGLWADLLERPVAVVLEHLAELTRYATYLLRHAHLTSITARMLDLQVRRAAVPALADAAGRLGVGARYVVFGHVHRAGPDGPGSWEPHAGGPRLFNTGSWVYEPLLLERAAPPHPYWPGGAVLVEDVGEPRVLRLLDDLGGEALTGGRAG